MAAADASSRHLVIKKYSNRRFYDTTRSRHVTLSDMYELICDGYDLGIIDSETREDITNVVLTQIIIERDAPKLAIFPANILHQMIRTKNQFLEGVLEQFFRQVLATHRESQERWAKFLENTLGFVPPMASAPLDWTRQWMDALGGRGGPPREPTGVAGPPPDEPAAAEQNGAAAADGDEELADLRRKVTELTRRVERMSKRRK